MMNKSDLSLIQMVLFTLGVMLLIIGILLLIPNIGWGCIAVSVVLISLSGLLSDIKLED